MIKLKQKSQMFTHHSFQNKNYQQTDRDHCQGRNSSYPCQAKISGANRRGLQDKAYQRTRFKIQLFISSIPDCHRQRSFSDPP